MFGRDSDGKLRGGVCVGGRGTGYWLQASQVLAVAVTHGHIDLWHAFYCSKTSHKIIWILGEQTA